MIAIEPDLRERFDELIQERAGRATIAPPEFVASELRRACMRYYDPHFNQTLLEKKFYDQMGERSEQEYACYCKPEARNPRLISHWKSIYAGCNAQIESFLDENGFEVAFRELGFRSMRKYKYAVDEYVPTPYVLNTCLPDKIRLYLTGIGYLYPDGNRSIVHPNLLLAHTNTAFGDTLFLTRDLIRAPYHAVERERELTGEQMWGYWRTLVTLAHSKIPEYTYPRIDDPPEKYAAYLEEGARLVPRRYLERDPVLETFDWDT